MVFAAALCWRLDQIRRKGGGLQAIAMTVAIAALTLAFVVSGRTASHYIDDALFAGSARLTLYGMLAVGVAALIIVFFFPAPEVTRERRAGIEAIPLVVALIGLQISLVVIPPELRSEQLGDWTFQTWGFALFYLIASGYLMYGFSACVRSVRKFFAVADGYLRVSLGLLSVGLTLLAVGSLVQIVAVLGSATGLVGATWTLLGSRTLDIVGVVAFLLGISFPMLHSRWRELVVGRRRRRDVDDLAPLWELVTEAIPEVVLPTGRMGSTERLHRMVVEIRDALTQLSPLLPADFDALSPSEQVASLREAVSAYRDAGAVSGAVRPILPAEGDGLDAEAAPLLEVSRAVSTPMLAA